MALTGWRYSAPLNLPDASEAADKTTQLEINYLLNAVRTLASHLDQVTGALSPFETDFPQYVPDGAYVLTLKSKTYAKVSAAINYGAIINLHDVAGELNARPARANSTTTVGAGFCNTPGGYAAGETGEFICGPGINTGIGGLTIGAWYYLDPASLTGQVTAAAPGTPGDVYQNIGIAIAANKLLIGSFNNWIPL